MKKNTRILFLQHASYMQRIFENELQIFNKSLPEATIISSCYININTKQSLVKFEELNRKFLYQKKLGLISNSILILCRFIYISNDDKSHYICNIYDIYISIYWKKHENIFFTTCILSIQMNSQIFNWSFTKLTIISS